MKIRLVLALVAGLACTAVAQPPSDAPKAPAKKPDSKAPAAQPPAGDDDMQKAMEAMMAAAQPGPMHEFLAKSVGTWEGKVKAYPPIPGAPPSESVCTTTFSSMFDGRFTRSETKGDMGGEPFRGFALYGYDNVAKQFQFVWLDTMGTGMMIGTGTLADDSKTVNWTCSYHDPMTGKPAKCRMVDTHIDANTTRFQMFGPGRDGKELPMLEIDYTRKSIPATKLTNPDDSKH